MAKCGGNCHGQLSAPPRHLLIDSVGNLLLGSCLSQHGLSYPLPDGLDCPECGGQGLLSSTAPTGDSWGRVAAMAHPCRPIGNLLSWEPCSKVWVCKAQLLVINFAQSSKGKMSWIASVASVCREKGCDRSISWHISLPIYYPNLIITNRVWLKYQEHTFRSLVCNLQQATEKFELLCFFFFSSFFGFSHPCPKGFRQCFIHKAWSAGPVEDNRPRLRGLFGCLCWQTDVVQIKLALLCCLKIHKCECLLVPGYLCAFVSSSYLGAASAVFLGESMYFLFFLTEVTGISVFRGRVVVVLLGKSQINLCTAHMDASVRHSSSPFFWRGHKQVVRGNGNLLPGKIPIQWIWKKFRKQNSELSFFTVFSVPPLKTQAQHFFFHESSYCSLSTNSLLL